MVHTVRCKGELNLPCATFGAFLKNNFSSEYMTYRLLSIAVLIELLTLSPIRICAQPVVRQLTVSDANQTQFLLYSYDTDGRLLFERLIVS